MFGVFFLTVSLEAAVSFLSFGDWGGSFLGSLHANEQTAVAVGMDKVATELKAKFIINTGDNYYYCGVRNSSDVQFETDYLNVYKADSLQVPWYSSLGNHDYGYDVDVQINWEDPSKRWVMPARYYTKRIQLAASEYISLIVLDASPCVSAYRSDNQKGWDPCGGHYPDCNPTPEQCMFHPNVLSQDCGKQLTWLKAQLASVPKDDWLLVVSHNPITEMDVEPFEETLLEHGFDLYLNGHTHTLTQYSVKGNSKFVTTGAGSMVHTADQEEEEHLHELESLYGDYYNTVWTQKVAGFTAHTFSEDFKTLTTTFRDNTGGVLHSFTVTKGSPSPGPSPPPAPAPGPAPGPDPSPSTGSCKSYGCGSYSAEHKCQCNPGCTTHKDCCSDYKTCGKPTPSPAPAPPAPPAPAAGSCKSYGCGTYSADHKCQCNPGCSTHKDCCSDYKTCGKPTPAPAPPAPAPAPSSGTCNLKCGEPKDSSEPCQCDSGCGKRGDCCKDYKTLCDSFDKIYI